jgi:DNA-binding response OmpR family regulator
MMTDILIIEDNIELANILQDFLTHQGYKCAHEETGEKGLTYLDKHTVRLVLLDVMLPKMDGFAVCKEIHQTRNIPTIIISAKTHREDKLIGLNLGADDYIEKPYDIDLLLAKIKALYRRYYTENIAKIISSGVVSIDTESRIAFVNNNAISLSIKEYDLLLLFLQNEGKTLRKEYIFDKVWGVDSDSEPSTLTVHIKWLRQKIEMDSKKPKYIETIWGVGYKFNEEI